MADSPSSSSSTPKEYDVFISFRGEDTRYNFTSHLVSALRSKPIRVYVDYELKKGDEISSSLIKAIHDSYGSLIVFSENYASSKWCLNELVQILECRKQGHFVIPVFYNTDPSCVRKQTASYDQAFQKHEQDSRNKEKLPSWKVALTEAANIVGWDNQSPTNRDESELIKNIVNDIAQRMGHIYQPSQSSFVGIDKYCEEIELLLQRTQLVGIWGIGGVGKTTIANVIFNKLFSQYDSSYFFENIREESERNGLNYIQNKLLSELLKDANFHSGKTKSLPLNLVMRRLSGKKVLIVLDDVNSSKQLEQLKEEFKCLGADSKVMITTRDRQVLVGLEVDYEIYEVEGLDFENSLELFRLNAFNKKYPEIDESITKKVVDYAGGNPLALKVLGSLLLSKSKEEWESALKKLNKIPNDDIQKNLRLSYDGLDPLDQQIFLDIACFLKGDHIEDVISLLDSFGFCGRIGMRNLQDKALVTILYGNIVHMHDLLQEMGRNIVRQESPKYIGKRSRLWDLEEVYEVLTNDKGTNAIEGVMLDLSQIKDLSLKKGTFKKMIDLRFVKFYSSSSKSCKVHLPKSIVLPSKKLRYFHWDEYPLPSLPTNFCVEKLVKLCISESNIIKLWDGLQDIVHLKEINLSQCTKLMELPDFSKASKLEHVNLSNCSNLCRIHSSLLHLDTLVVLNVRRCEKLTILKSERHLRSLCSVWIDGCLSLEKISLSTEKVEELCFDGTSIQILPSSLSRCRNLTKLKFGELLAEIPSEIYILSSLKSLCIRGSRVNKLPETIKYLLCLQHLDVTNCRWLRSLPELPPSVKILLAKNCHYLKTLIPLTELETCDLGNCVNLDEQAFSCITSYARYRVKQVEPTQLCLPGDRVLPWFTYRSTLTTISIKLPPRSDLLGFVCYLKARPTTSIILCMGCKCYFGYNDTGKLKIGECHVEFVNLCTKPNSGDVDAEFDNLYTKPNSGDVDMWIHKFHSSSALKRRRANGLFSFEFFTNTFFPEDSNNIIEECGVWPIYALELELGNNFDENRCELESFEHQRIKVGGFHEKDRPQKLLGEFTIQPVQRISELELGDRRQRFWDDRR